MQVRGPDEATARRWHGVLREEAKCIFLLLLPLNLKLVQKSREHKEPYQHHTPALSYSSLKGIKTRHSQLEPSF